MPWEKKSIGLGNPEYLKKKFDLALKKLDDTSKLLQFAVRATEATKVLFLAASDPLVFVFQALIRETENLIKDFFGSGFYLLSLIPGDKSKFTGGSGVTTKFVEKINFTADTNLIGSLVSLTKGNGFGLQTVQPKGRTPKAGNKEYVSKRPKWFWPEVQLKVRALNDTSTKFVGEGDPTDQTSKKKTDLTSAINGSIYLDSKSNTFWKKAKADALGSEWSRADGNSLFSLDDIKIKGKGIFDWMGFPLLTPPQILEKTLASLDDTADANRPVFTDSSGIAGIGFIITFPYLFDFVNLIQPFIGLFGFKPLVDYLNKLLAYLPPDLDAEPKTTGEAPLPNWRRAAVADIPVVGPFVGEWKDIFIEWLNTMRGLINSTDQAILDLFDIYGAKLEEISTFVKKVNDFMTFLEKAFLAQGIYVYTFSAETGGVKALKADLLNFGIHTFKTKPEDRDNPKLSIPLDQMHQNKYSAGMFVVAGGPSATTLKTFGELIKGTYDLSSKAKQQNEIKKIAFWTQPADLTKQPATPDAGTWRIGWKFLKLKTDKKETPESTKDIKFSATAADVQDAINATYAFSEVEVTGSYPEFTVEFKGIDGKKDQPDFLFVGEGDDEVQRITVLNGPADRGSFKISFNGKETPLYDITTTASVIQDELNKVMFAGGKEKQRLRFNEKPYQGTMEVTSITFNDGGAFYSVVTGKYFSLSNLTTTYAVWICVTDAVPVPVVPTVAGSTLVKVDVLTADTAAGIAAKVKTALTPYFTVSEPTGSKITTSIGSVGVVKASVSSVSAGVSTVVDVLGTASSLITGTFTLTFNGRKSSVISYPAEDFTAASLKTALETIVFLAPEKITVTEVVSNGNDPKQYDIEWVELKDQPQIKVAYKDGVFDGEGNPVLDNNLVKGVVPVRVETSTLIQGSAPSESILVDGTFDEGFTFSFTGDSWGKRPLTQEISIAENSLAKDDGEGSIKPVGLMPEIVTKGAYPPSNLTCGTDDKGVPVKVTITQEMVQEGKGMGR